MGLIGEKCQSCKEASEADDGGGLAGSWWRAWGYVRPPKWYWLTIGERPIGLDWCRDRWDFCANLDRLPRKSMASYSETQGSGGYPHYIISIDIECILTAKRSTSTNERHTSSANHQPWSTQIAGSLHNIHPQHISVKRQLCQEHKCLANILNIHHRFNLVTPISLESPFTRMS
jgi:hypothetical protein